MVVWGKGCEERSIRKKQWRYQIGVNFYAIEYFETDTV